MGQVIPVASEIKKLPEGRCIPILRPPVFDTTPPGVGGRLKPRCARHGNFTPPRIAPSRPSGRAYHCVLTRSLRNSFGISKTAHPLFDMRCPHPLHKDLSLRNVNPVVTTPYPQVTISLQAHSMKVSRCNLLRMCHDKRWDFDTGSGFSCPALSQLISAKCKKAIPFILKKDHIVPSICIGT